MHSTNSTITPQAQQQQQQQQQKNPLKSFIYIFFTS
jgi:hypothetical protein